MSGTHFKSFITGLLAATALAGSLGAAQAGVPSASYAAVGAETSVPYGWVDFCQRYRGECDGSPSQPLDINLTAETFREIERVDRSVNKSITPVSDMAHWGVLDQWDIPTDGKGDCEDYALEKRRELIAAGYPRQALLMTVVKDRADEGHAILTVKTDHGEFVLDNMTDAMLPWDQTGYRFVKRQSQSDQNAWNAINPSVSAPLYTARQDQLPNDMRR